MVYILEGQGGLIASWCLAFVALSLSGLHGRRRGGSGGREKGGGSERCI
jgi:hypothetical protein